MRVFVAAFKSDEYKYQALAFKKATENLLAKAKAKNIDGATLAYSDMTRSCVGCHQSLRGQKQ